MKRWLKRLLRPASRAPKVAAPPVIDHRALGDAARGRRDWAGAGRHYSAHLDSDPDDFGIWIQLGHVLKEQGLLEEAEAAYGGAGALNDQSADLWLSRGHLAKLRSQNLKAREFYTRSYAIDANANALSELLALGVSATELQLDPDTPEGRFAAQATARVVGSIDIYSGSALVGWVTDPDDPHTPAEVEVLRGGRIIARGRGSCVRDDLRVPGLEDRLTGFSIPLGDKARVGDVVNVRLKRTREPLANSPLTLEPSLAARRWLARHQDLTPNEVLATRANYTRETAGMRLSIIMTVADGPVEWIRQAIDSVLGQWCPNWELLCIDDGSADAAIRDVLVESAAKDSRIRVVGGLEGGGRSGAISGGITASAGDYVAVMDSWAFLEPEAVFRFLDAGLSGAGVIYADEIVTREGIEDLRDFVMRPAFSYDLYLANPDLGGFVCYRADLARASAGQVGAGGASVEVDLTLGILERAEQVAHVPAILYRSRDASGSARRTSARKSAAILGALNRHLKRSGSDAIARPGFRQDNYAIDYPDDRGRTLIIIPTRDRIDLLDACLEAIWRTTDAKDVEIVVIDHESSEPKSKQYLRKIRKRVKVVPFSGTFNYAKMNNEAARTVGASCKYVVFMNNDIEAISGGWLEHMRSLAARPDVGVVGSTLLYDDGRIQHAGVVLGVGGPVNHAHKFTAFETDGVRTPGPNASLISTRDYVAVTGACTMMRSEVFFGVGGFDEDLPVDFNDIDLCLRVGRLGYRILNDAHAVLYHHESATRKKGVRVRRSAETAIFIRRWHQLLATGDPFYNPLMSLAAEHEVGHIVDVSHPARIRPVKGELLPLERGLARRISTPLRYP